MRLPALLPGLLLATLSAPAPAAGAEPPAPAPAGPYAAWKNWPAKDASFFPIAVWLQSPANAQIRELAPALNSPAVRDGVAVESSDRTVPVAAAVRKHAGATYVFAVAMKPGQTEATFAVAGLGAAAEVEVLGEGRKLQAAGGKFKDSFRDWDVHLYRIK